MILTVKIVAASLIALGSLLTIISVGKERKPTTGGVAAGALIINAFFILAIFL